MPRLPLVLATFATVVVIGCTIGTEPMCACPPARSRVRVVGDVRTATGEPVPFARVFVGSALGTTEGTRRFYEYGALADDQGRLDDTVFSVLAPDTGTRILAVNVPGSDDTIEVTRARLRFRYEGRLLTDTLLLRLP